MSMRLSAILDGLMWGARLGAIAVGLMLYVVSFFGFGWREGGFALWTVFILIVLTSLPTALRDRRFFMEHWGFGLMGIRKQFPFQSFPARDVKWLNPLVWSLIAVLLLHFAFLVMDSHGHRFDPTHTTADLRYQSLMVTICAVINTLLWKYPPTRKPEDVDRRGES